MAASLIRFDLSLPNYFTYAPAPGVAVRPQIPRKQPKGLYMRGEIGEKHDGSPRLMTAHNTTHLDVPFHFYEQGADLAAVLNQDTVADRPALARVVILAGRKDVPGVHTHNGVTYCEGVSAAVLPGVEELRRYEALVVITGFGELMAAQREGQYPRNPDGFYHVPYLTEDAVDVIVKAGIAVVGIDSTTVEPQISAEPHRMGSDAHFRLLGNEPPVLILEGLNGTGFMAKVGFLPQEALLHIVPRRVNAKGADAGHSRVFLYFYRHDADGRELRQLKAVMTPHEVYG